MSSWINSSTRRICVREPAREPTPVRYCTSSEGESHSLDNTLPGSRNYGVADYTFAPEMLSPFFASTLDLLPMGSTYNRKAPSSKTFTLTLTLKPRHSIPR